MYPRRLNEITEKTGGSRKYARTKTPPVTAMVVGSAEEMFWTVVDAIGWASWITFPVCPATSATVYNTNNYKVFEISYENCLGFDIKDNNFEGV